MCGIAGIHRRGDKPVTKLGQLIDALLLGIAERGPDSTGALALLDSGKVQMEKAPVPARKFVDRRKRFDDDARTEMLHTRYATVGAVNAANAHPQISGRCAAVHNGTIRNATALFKTFGLKRRAEVDSEIIPALIDHAGWENAEAALELMEGGCATAVVNADHPTELILARTTTMPLVWFATDDYVVWASTERAIQEALRFAYGRVPKGEWGMLGTWSVLRVNGSLELGRLDPIVPSKPKVKTSAKGKRRKARKAAATKKATGRAESRPVATRRLALTPDYPGPQEGVDGAQWAADYTGSLDDAVDALVRWSGMTRAEAFDAVYGPDMSEGQTPLWH